jgi:hypothetical protein
MKLPSIRDRHSSLQIALVVLVAVAISVRSLQLSVDQFRGVILPGVDIGAPLAVIVMMVVHRLPSRGRLPLDSETDYIVCGVGLILGLWVIYWGPHKLGTLFLLWRPDLLGCAVCAVSVAALIGGTRFALWVAPSLIAVGIATTPVVQVSLAGVLPTAFKIAMVSGVLAALPLLVARPLRGAWILARTGAVVVVSAAVGEATHILQTPADAASLLAALAAVVAAEVVGIALGSVSKGTVMPNVGLVAWRLIPVAVAVGIVGAADVSISLPAQPTASASSAMIVPVDGHLIGQYATENHLVVSAWTLKDHLPENMAVMVVTTTAARLPVVQTYPSQELLTWAASPCPNVSHLHVNGIAMTGTVYPDNLNGYRWEQYEWLTHAGSRFQRVSVIIATSPSGEVVPLPSVAPTGVAYSVSTAAILLADRHLICGVKDVADAALTRRALFQVINQEGAHAT